MVKYILKSISFLLLFGVSTLFLGCNNSSSEAEVLEEQPKTVEEKQIKNEPKKIVYTKNDSIVSDVFNDVAKIAPNGKQMILIFGTNTDPYSDKLKADIKNNKELQEKLKNDFSSYYFKAHENLRHKQYHEGQLMDVDTKTMILVYGIEATPTIIFTDKEGKAVIVVPGYMPTNQFLVTMNFMKSNKWQGKDRKNGEVYEALRDFYIENGINVSKKDK